MRIVIDLQSCQNGSRFRGIGRYSMELTRSLLRIAPEHDFLILLSDRFPGTVTEVRKALDDVAGADRFILFSTNDRTTSADPANAWRCRTAELIRASVLDQLHPDAVLVPSLIEGLWDNCVVSVEPRPYITAVTIHDLIPLTFPDQVLGAADDRAAYYRKLHSLRHTDLILTPSEFVRGEVLRELGIAPHRVVTTLEGADAKFSPAVLTEERRSNLANRFGFDRPFVLNTSPLEHRKNLEGLIAGFGSLPADMRNAHQLVIVGKMDEYGVGYLRKLAATEGLTTGQLVLTGRVSDKDLVDLYRASALFCFPSISEGFGLPVLEAMRSGTIAIGSNTSSVPEVIGSSECLFDPTEPAECAAVMARALSDEAWRRRILEAQGRQAAALNWESTAARTLNAILTTAKVNRSGVNLNSAGLKRTASLIVVFPASPARGRFAGYIDALVDQLSENYDVQPVSIGTTDQSSWRAANYETQDADWLRDHGSSADRILYVTTRTILNRMIPFIRMHAGSLLVIEDPASDYVGDDAAFERQRLLDLYAASGYGALVEVDELSSSRPGHLHSAGLLNRVHGVIVEKAEETSPRIIEIPPLPVRSRAALSQDLRRTAGLPQGATVILAHVRDGAIAAPFNHAFRGSDEAKRKQAHVIVLSGRLPSPEVSLVGSFPGRTIRKGPDEYDRYQDYVALADAIYIAPDVDPALARQFAVDAHINGKPLIREASIEAIDDALNAKPLIEADAGVVEASPVGDAIEHLMQNSPLRGYHDLLRALPQRVGKSVATAADLESVAVAIATNELANRAPQILIDVSGLIGLWPLSHIERRLKSTLRALLTVQHSKRIELVRFDGRQFVYARRLAAKALDVDLPLDDETLLPRVGDRFVGIDLLNSFNRPPLEELVRLLDQGVMFTYVKSAANLVDQETIAIDRIRIAIEQLEVAESVKSLMESTTLIDIVQSMRSANIPVEIVAFEDVQATSVQMFDYAVTGHVLGYYSLAIINRAVAAAIEAAHPGRTRVIPVETTPVSDLSLIPSDERGLIEKLTQRLKPVGDRNISISQHYPVLVPERTKADLSLALFAHEESRVLPSVALTLNNGFDAVLATSSVVEKALIDSGVTIPVMSIGQPTASEFYETIGRSDRPHRPIRTFLHISSFFLRKGPDVLLEAWRRAFNRNERVKLIIKTFPNPHNDVEERVRILRAEYPGTAPIEVINEDLGKSDLASLYREADVMVLPTRGEGFNLPALESMLARLPLIVTGHGGHLDFCTDDEARMIRYRIEPSRSHVRSALSLWAEPDVDDLVHAFREAVDPSHREAIRARADRARISALGAADKVNWVRRLDAAVADLARITPASTPRTAWITTWGVQCGIAQHSEFLFDSIATRERESFAILCDVRTASQNDTFVRPIWKTGEVPQRDVIAAEVEAFAADAIVIQHQDGLIAWSELTRICEDPRFNTRVLVIVLHNPRAIHHLSEVERYRLFSALAKASRVIVHNVSDVNLMISFGLGDIVTLLPPGALNAVVMPKVRFLAPDEHGPVIGCHGFAFPHKGIDKLMRAVAELRPRWPAIRLRLVTAEFPDQKSRETITSLRQLANDLGLADAIEWHTAFLPVETITKLLSECDLLVLPYDQSQDSASGAARICLSSLAPTLATRVQIFEEMQHAFAGIDTNDPVLLANEINSLLQDENAREDIQQRMATWLSDFDWKSMMGLMTGMIQGLASQRRANLN
jgi:glycosyltransferase involved in cell wall biosynthesis